MGILARRIAVGQECPAYIQGSTMHHAGTLTDETRSSNRGLQHFPELRHCQGFVGHLQCWERDSAEIRDVQGK